MGGYITGRRAERKANARRRTPGGTLSVAIAYTSPRRKFKGGYKWNHFDVETGDRYWISGPRKDGPDRLYAQSSQPVEIDDDVREEYWIRIRG